MSPKCSTKAPQKRQKSKQKLLGQALKKHLFFQSVLFSKCARKAPQTGHPTRQIWVPFSTSFRTWLPRVAQTLQNAICYSILLQKSWKSCIGLLFDAFLLHRFCLHTCACASVLVHLFSPFVGYVFPSSCYQRQSSRMMCKTGWCGDATPQASSILEIHTIS